MVAIRRLNNIAGEDNVRLLNETSVIIKYVFATIYFSDDSHFFLTWCVCISSAGLRNFRLVCGENIKRIRFHNLTQMPF